MKYLLLAIAMFTLLAFTLEPPVECDDADREIRGNRTTPCKLELPTITVEYRFRMDYPYCIEEMAFNIPGVGRTEKPRVYAIEAYMRAESGPAKGGGYVWYNDDMLVLNDHIVLQAYLPGLTIASPVNSESRFGNPRPGLDHIALRIGVDGVSKNYSIEYIGIPRPSTDSKVSLANSCLALLMQEKEDREHAERLKQEEAAKQAELKAQRDAELKAESQAKREAENQERLAKLELQVVLDNKITAANTELIKTQTLIPS